MAADLGGNCCSDLEERVAELEATTARKGNRRVSLEVSGHVHEGIMFWDDGFDSGVYIGTVNYSRTRFRFKGSAQINADWSAGFLIEIGLRQTGNSSSWDQAGHNPTGMDIRHQALYVKSKRLGTVWLGHTSEAVDGISDICLGCPISSTHESQLGWSGFESRFGAGLVGPSWGTIGAGNMVASDQARRQLIRYISPEFAGFVFSADWGADEDFDSPDNWSVALRYANEFNGVRVAGGIGYFSRDDRAVTLPAGAVPVSNPNIDQEGWGASASIQHVATGIFVAGSYGERTENDLTAAGLGLAAGSSFNDTTDGWSVVAGFGRKFSPLGASTFWVRYGEFTGESFQFANADAWTGESTVLGLGFNQKIDAAAMEFYVSYYHVTGDLENLNGNANVSVEDFDAVLFGSRIQF
jgi:predicted porin